MTSVDKRTRFAGSVEVKDAAQLFTDLAERLDETGALAARGVELLALAPLTLEVDGTAAHLVVADGALRLREGRADEGPIVGLDTTACSELFQDLVSTFGLVMPGRVEMLRPRGDQFVAWEPVLRAAIDGRAVHEPGSVRFRDRAGNDLDLRRGFRIDDEREEIGHFLAEAGYLHPRVCSPRRRWRRCRPSSTRRWPRRRRTTARRGGPAPRTAGTRRASSAST
jgi:hypothetical protein